MRLRWLSLLLLLSACSMRPTMPQPPGFESLVELRVDGGSIDTPFDAGELTLAAALDRGLRHDPRLGVAIAEVHVAFAEARQARLLPNPVLSVALKYPETGGSPMIEGGVGADLLAILQTPGRTRAADHRLRAASAAMVRVALDVLTELQSTYADVQSLDARIPLLRERLVLMDRLHAIAQARLDAGEAGWLELVAFAAERAAVDAALDELLLKRREQRLRLARLIGRPSGEAEWALESRAEPPHQSVRERPWIDAALEHRPELRQITWELAALGEDVKLAGGAALDSADAGVAAEREDGDWSIGPSLAVPLPLFDWGQARKAGTEARAMAMRHALTQAQREAVEEVRRACAVFNESVHELRRAREQLLPLQQERRDLVEATYRAGQADVTAVILAEQDLASARSHVIDMEHRVTASRIALHRAVGGRAVADQLTDTNPDAVSTDIAPIEPPHTEFEYE